MAMRGPENTIIEEWYAVEVPPAPELAPVEVDPQETALLVLDIQNQNCNPEKRPRCVASVPKIQRLLAKARDKGVLVVYSLTRNASETDIRADLSPLEGEPVVRSGVDKFYGTELEEVLRSKGIRTLILVGTSAHGAILHTAAGAASRGFRVIVPVDGMSAGEPYAEQYTSWHLVNSPGTRRQTILTRISLVQLG